LSHPIKKGYISRVRERHFKGTTKMVRAVRKVKRTRKSYSRFNIKIISLG
jgi:hypothetical protein